MLNVGTTHLHIIFDSLITLLRINQITLLLQFANECSLCHSITFLRNCITLKSLLIYYSIIQQIKYEIINIIININIKYLFISHLQKFAYVSNLLIMKKTERSKSFLLLSRFHLLSRQNGWHGYFRGAYHYFNGYTCRGYFGSVVHRAPTFEEDWWGMLTTN